MGLTRFVLLVVIGAWLWYAFKNYQRKQENRSTQSDAARQQRIVKCQHCGLHLPENEAVSAQQQYFCSADHLSHWQQRK